jgi:hypothetical protein
MEDQCHDIDKEDISTRRQTCPISVFLTLDGPESNKGLLSCRPHNGSEYGLHMMCACFEARLEQWLY